MKMYNTYGYSAIRDYMVRNHYTLAAAESVSSGHLQAALFLAREATLFFQGGITACCVLRSLRDNMVLQIIDS